MDKTLSIIIPCYNVEKYIEECLESVCNDRDADIEVICVNDGSADNTLSIIEQWKQKDPRIIVINQENRGLSAARNQGMNIARGQFIYFLDSDDKVTDLAILKKCCKKMREDDLDILIGAGRSFFETEELNKKFSQYEKSYQIEHEYPGVTGGTELMAELQKNREWEVQQSTRIYSRKFLQDNNICYTEGQIHEDNYVAFWCMYMAGRTTAVKDVLFERRIRENSVVTQKITHKNVEGYLVNFIQDLYLITEHRAEIMPDMDVSFPLGIARRNVKRTYRLLDEEEKTCLEGNLTKEQKFYFDTLIGGEIEAADMLEHMRKRLQEAYAEKSEINRKLQITYDEKRERGIQIRKQEKEIKELKEQLKKTQYSLKRYEQNIVIRALKKIRRIFLRAGHKLS